MQSNGLITLLSDFGDQDIYVGVMKGAIACINPSVKVIDLTHHVPPQNIAAARFNLSNAYPYFPSNTVHVAVVDPGVGGRRRAIALRLAGGILVGPDNGLFSGVIDREPVIEAVELDQPTYWRVVHPSSTFHGRDIFAPVAAYLASGTAITAVGTPFDPATLVRLEIAPARTTANGLEGSIQYIDRFGNAVTTVPAEAVAGTRWQIEVNGTILPGATTYGDVEVGNCLGLMGSHGWVEVAVNRGNAQAHLQLEVGSLVRVVMQFQEKE